jgi:hypothetical protein
VRLVSSQNATKLDRSHSRLCHSSQGQVESAAFGQEGGSPCDNSVDAVKGKPRVIGEDDRIA